MKTLAVIAISLLVSLASAAPTSDKDNDTVIVTDEYFLDELVIYTSQHDIVDLLTPLNDLNFEDDDESEGGDEITFFFIEADVNNGVKDFKGLYVIKNKTAIQLLDNAKDFTSSNENNTAVYFAADDGIYVYDANNTKAVKHCSLVQNLIGITKVNGSDAFIYILNNQHEVYKVNELCDTKVKVDSVKNAQQIIQDYSSNLYFYAEDKKPYALVGDVLVKVEGLPENPSSVRLIRPAFVVEDGVLFLSDDKLYVIYANGTSEHTDFILQTKPTAYSMEASLIHYYAHNKKIYEYNILMLLLGDLLTELKQFLQGKSDEIQNIASRSRDNFISSGSDFESTTKRD